MDILLGLLLTDLHKFGAVELERLIDDYGQADVSRWLDDAYLARIPTPLSILVALGSEGRRHLGLSPYYLSPPEAAATQLIRRRVRAILVKEGWQYKGQHGRNLMVFELAANRCYVLARYGGYTTRSVRRVLAGISSKLIGEGSYLLVWTQNTQLLSLKSTGLVLVRDLDTLI